MSNGAGSARTGTIPTSRPKLRPAGTGGRGSEKPPKQVSSNSSSKQSHYSQFTQIIKSGGKSREERKNN